MTRKISTRKARQIRTGVVLAQAIVTEVLTYDHEVTERRTRHMIMEGALLTGTARKAYVQARDRLIGR